MDITRIKALLKKRLKARYQALELFALPSVDSTNEWAKREMGKREIAVFLADHQSAGRGSRERRWSSPLGTSISMSICIEAFLELDRLPMLTLVMGLSAAEAIRDQSSLPVQIKWPNDLVVSGKKLAGILTELSADQRKVIIGIGVNTGMSDFPEELRERATSIKIETGRDLPREDLTAEILYRFLANLEQFRACQDMSSLRMQYESLLVNQNRQVKILDESHPYEGTARGIDILGNLLVKEKATGKLQRVHAGEVSVRGVYGYV